MSEQDYEVGYGKPPKEHRFKVGQSGNPKGRPPEKKTMTAAEFVELLDAPVPARRKGKYTEYHPYEAGMLQLVRKVLNNQDMAAAREFLNECKAHKIIEPRTERQYGGVVYVPLDVDRHEFMARVYAEGPPPWNDDE